LVELGPAEEKLRTKKLRTGNKVNTGAILQLLLLTATSLWGCTGIVMGDAPPGTGDPSVTNAASSPAEKAHAERAHAATVNDETAAGPSVVEQRFTRLSHAEWDATVVDLLGLPESTGLPATFAPDPLGSQAFDNAQVALGVGPDLWSDYQAAAETLAARVTGEPALLDALLQPEAGSRSSSPTDSRLLNETRFIESFGLRAYRRPLSEEEVAAHLALFDSAPDLYPELDPFVAGVRANLTAFMQSPYFSYRSVLGSANSDSDAVPLDAWELASQLSYAVWNSMPDGELFRAAAAGELATDAGVRTQVERLVSAPRARTAVGHFFEQLYESQQYRQLSKDLTVYPSFTPDLVPEMQGELARFTDDIFQHDGGLRELLTSTTTFVTPRLAAIYGLAPSALKKADAGGFSRVELDPTQRSGLLTRSGFLAWKSGDSEPNTIQRGVFIVRHIICQELGNPPPAAVGATLGGQTTDRARVEALTGAGTCGAGCHGVFIDPAGYAFEHYGALGEYRETDAGEPIDASATYPFATGSVSYRDAGELSQALADSPQAHSCFSSYLLEFLLGHVPTSSETALLADLSSRSLAGASTRALVVQALSAKTLRRRALVPEAL
jgi:Protein of unknown function (DUF1592)/Protein of unknown function (DUF1588)/Protein of unknown function (DUF1595)/Protein of unknown function (DUF1587)